MLIRSFLSSLPFIASLFFKKSFSRDHDNSKNLPTVILENSNATKLMAVMPSTIIITENDPMLAPDSYKINYANFASYINYRRVKRKTS